MSKPNLLKQLAAKIRSAATRQVDKFCAAAKGLLCLLGAYIQRQLGRLRAAIRRLLERLKPAAGRFAKKAKRCLLWAAAVVVSLALVSSLLAWGYVSWQKHRTGRAFAITSPQGIDKLTVVGIDGMEQWVSIRGEDKNNPVLLFVHGGPGSPAMPFIREHNRGLEKHFVVVNWDQRRAGKSYNKEIPDESMTLDQFVRDCLAVVAYLRRELNVDKIYLAGISWGGVVGVHAVQRQPEWFHAYIGIGQTVNFIESEKISFRYTRDQARVRAHHQARTELAAIKPPPYQSDQFAAPLTVQRRWLFEFGGEIYGQGNSFKHRWAMLQTLLYAPEYSLLDVWNTLQGNRESVEMLWDELLQVDLISQVPKLEVPVYFIHGRHDYLAAWELVERYCNVLEAPAKHLIWFDFSAHSPNLEQPKGFVRVMVERVLAETLP